MGNEKQYAELAAIRRAERMVFWAGQGFLPERHPGFRGSAGLYTASSPEEEPPGGC